MPELVLPTNAVHASYVGAAREFHAEGRNHEIELRRIRRRRRFATYVAQLHAAAQPETRRPAGRVPETTLWYVDGDQYIGEVQIRHELTDTLRQIGGHIGYEVRPTARRQGHATRMLALALPIAHALGIDPALVTCDTTNVASRKVIEANGGVPDAPFGVKLRYWVKTS